MNDPGKNAEKQKIVDKKEDEDWGKGAKGPLFFPSVSRIAHYSR
jgi:hypothetical protein